MPARVIIHPRCLNGPAAGALEAVLQAKGFQPGELAIGPANAKGHCDLVRLIDKDGDHRSFDSPRMREFLGRHPFKRLP